MHPIKITMEKIRHNLRRLRLLSQASHDEPAAKPEKAAPAEVTWGWEGAAGVLCRLHDI